MRVSRDRTIDGVVDGGEVVPASVTVEGGGSYMDCFSDASLEPPAIAVYNSDILGVYLVFIIPHDDGQPGMSLLDVL